MAWRSGKAFGLWLLLLTLVSGLGAALILPRHEGAAEPRLELRDDAELYLALAEGTPVSEVMVPFRYRVLVPWIAGLLPLPAASAMAAITFLCLGVVLWGMVLIACRLGFGSTDTVIGILAVSLSASLLYTFHNPYLTDMFGQMAVVAAILALLDRRPLAFALIVMLGAAGREVVVFIAPAYLLALWWTGDRRPNERWPVLAAGVLLPVAAILVPRMLPVFGEQGLRSYSGFYGRTLFQWLPLRQPLDFLLGVGLGWHWLWLLGAAGLVWLGTGRLPGTHHLARSWDVAVIRVSFVLLAVGGVLVLVVNGMLDSVRHLFPVFTPLAIGLMAASARWRAALPAPMYLLAAAVLMGASLALALIRLPNRIMPGGLPWNAAMLPLLLAGIVLAICWLPGAWRSAEPANPGAA